MNFISKFLDPSKFTMVSDQAFNYFDKDKSGFIDSTEVTAAAQQVCETGRVLGSSPTAFGDSHLQRGSALYTRQGLSAD